MTSATITRWSAEEKPTLESIKEQLETEGVDYYTFVCAPGDSFDEHTHDAQETRIIVEGSMEYGVDNETHVLNAGDRITINANVTHTAKVVSTINVLCLGASL